MDRAFEILRRRLLRMTEIGGGGTNGVPLCRGGNLLGETIPSVTASLCHLPLLRGGLMSAEDDREWRMSVIGAPFCRGGEGGRTQFAPTGERDVPFVGAVTCRPRKNPPVADGDTPPLGKGGKKGWRMLVHCRTNL